MSKDIKDFIFENPNNIVYEYDDMNDIMKRMMTYPKVKQKSKEWFDIKKNFLSGSEMGSALDCADFFSRNKMIKRFNDERCYKEDMTQDDLFMRKCNLKPPIESNEAMEHGNKYEDLAGKMYSRVKNETTLTFGFIPDTEIKFIGVSPDLITMNDIRCVEIKSPFYRKLIKPEDLYQFELIRNSVLFDGSSYVYDAITNFPIKYSHLLDKIVYYYHQCQLQAYVIKSNIDIDFIQLMTGPNAIQKVNENEPTSLFTITRVKYDDFWMSRNIEKLTRLWDRIEKYRIDHPDWEEEKWEKKDLSFLPLTEITI